MLLFKDEITYGTGACGVAAPIILAGAALVAGLLRPGYDPLAQTLGDLGTMGGSAAAVMNIVGFGVTGVLVALLAVGLYLDVRGGAALKVLLLAVMMVAGAALILTGVFPSDSYPDIHTAAVYAVGGALGLAPMVGAVLFPQDPRWKPLWAYSLLTGIIALAVFALFVSDALPSSQGLVQRVYLAVPLLWAGASGFWIMRWN